MKNMICLGLITIICLLPAESFPGVQKQPVNIEYTNKGKGHLTPEEERQLIEMSHEIIEGSDSDSFLENWREGFRFIQKAKDSYRWVSFNDSEVVKGIALDSVVLFAISHTTEMLFGPIMVSVGYGNDWPQWLIGLLGTTGAIISVPGLDPLCIIIFAIYSKNKKFRNRIGLLRMGIAKGFSNTSRVVGLSKVLSRFIVEEAVSQRLLKMPGLYSVEDNLQGKSIFRFYMMNSESVGNNLEIEVDKNQAYLKRVSLRIIDFEKKDIKALKKYFKNFGFNIADILRDSLAVTQGKKNWGERFFVSRSEVSLKRNSFTEFKDRAVLLRPREKWRFERHKCKNLFKFET